MLEGVSDSPAQEARWLLDEVLLSCSLEDAARPLRRLVQRRQAREPLQYILGYVPFLDLRIEVEPPVLIPRPETEHWCSWLIERLSSSRASSLHVLDLCSGSGNVSLALAHHVPQAKVIGVDDNPAAVALAERNRQQLGIANAEFVQADAVDFLRQHREAVDVLVTNPPYVPAASWPSLQPEIQDWEDPHAIVSGEDGLDLIRSILLAAPKPSTVVVEVGSPEQVEQVDALLAEQSYSPITPRPQLADISAGTILH